LAVWGCPFRRRLRIPATRAFHNEERTRSPSDNHRQALWPLTPVASMWDSRPRLSCAEAAWISTLRPNTAGALCHMPGLGARSGVATERWPLGEADRWVGACDSEGDSAAADREQPEGWIFTTPYRQSRCGGLCHQMQSCDKHATRGPRTCDRERRAA
jgi:hypothetical protein